MTTVKSKHRAPAKDKTPPMSQGSPTLDILAARDDALKQLLKLVKQQGEQLVHMENNLNLADSFIKDLRQITTRQEAIAKFMDNPEASVAPPSPPPIPPGAPIPPEN